MIKKISREYEREVYAIPKKIATVLILCMLFAGCGKKKIVPDRLTTGSIDELEITTNPNTTGMSDLQIKRK